MYVKFQAESPTTGGKNIGSCENYVRYLEKEVVGKFFSQKEKNLPYKQVITEINRYSKGQLKKKDTKFYSQTIAPSENEIKHIINVATGKADIKDVSDLTKAEKEKVERVFMEYIRELHDVQARHYNREYLNSGADLKYYAKIEWYRQYKGNDEEVKKGNKKAGQRKNGVQIHAHTIQSRKAADRTHQISPLSNHRKKSKGVIQQGFNRVEYKQQSEELFDNLFQYERPLEEKFEYQLAISKNDESLKQKAKGALSHNTLIELRNSERNIQEQHKSISKVERDRPSGFSR